MITHATEKAVAALPEKNATDLSRRSVAAGDAFSTHLQETRSDRNNVSRVPPTRSPANRESVRSKPQEPGKRREPAAPSHPDGAEEMPQSTELSPQDTQASDVDGSKGAVDAQSEKDAEKRDSDANTVVHIFPIETSAERVVTDAAEEVAGNSPTSEIDATLAPVNDCLPSTLPSNVGSQNSIAAEAPDAAVEMAATPKSSEGKTVSPQSELKDPIDAIAPVTTSAHAEIPQEAPGIVSDASQLSGKDNSEKPLELSEISPPVAAAVSPIQIQNQQASVELHVGLEEQKPQLVNADAASSAPNVPSPKQSKPSGVVTFARYLVGEPKAPPVSIEPMGTALAPVDLTDTPESINSSTATEEENATRQDPVTRGDVNPILTPADAVQATASTLPPSLRKHMEAHNVGPATGSMGPPISDSQQARLMQRVAKAFRAAEEKGGEVQIRLSPPELGSMKLELSLTSGVLTAKLEVENQRAQTILLDSLPQLRDRLAEQGIRVEKFDVNLQQRDTGGQQSQHQHSSSERHARSASTSNRIPVESKSNENRISPRATVDATRLNVIV